MQIPKRLNQLFETIAKMRRPYCVGFVRGHSYLTEKQVLKLKKVLENNDSDDIIRSYEQKFSQLIGPGYGLSLASARMGFYLVMKALGIREKDEVILPGFTCSVMANAVLRTGATPVYSNISPKTFGSDAEEINKKITKHTKLIVAQHSFGIPCDMPPIVELGKKYGIPVLEDCAIALDSSLKGVKVGNWGDVAIFSTDHTKPVNTIIGGLVYTRNKSLFKRIQDIALTIPQLEKAHQVRLFRRFLFERSHYVPEKYTHTILDAYFSAFKKKLLGQRYQVTFLDLDYSEPKVDSFGYPYPAKMPAFLAQLGLFELDNWPHEAKQRKSLLTRYLGIMGNSKMRTCIPDVYFDGERDIVPLRFVFLCANQRDILEKMSEYIDVDWMWFQQPVICAVDGIEKMGYRPGSCQVSEDVCSTIINLPCALDEDWFPVLERRLRSLLTDMSN